MLCGSGGSKSRLAKAAGAEPSGRMRNARRCGAERMLQSGNVCWRFSELLVNVQAEEDFCWAVQKVQAVVARRTFRNQNVKSTPFSEHFWNLRCSKSARRCGGKHMSKSKL